MFWFPKFVLLISKVIFWFPNFIRLITENWVFDFQNLSVWFAMTLLIPKCVRLISQMTLLIYKMKRFVYPGVTSECRWSARPTTLLSEQNNMAARDWEGVVSLAHYTSIWCLSEVHIDGRKKGTRHEPVTRIWFPLASVADSLNGRDFWHVWQ